MKKINFNKKIVSLGLLILCLFSFIYIQPILASTWEDYSVEQGDDLFESYPYDFSVLYYDENNYSKQFTQAKLETQHAIYSDIYTNNSIVDLTNYYNYYPDDLTINQGINNSEGTLNNLDDDYYNISSTPVNYSIPSESNFSIINGTLNSFGDLQYSDDNFANFTSTEVGIYPATYSFTNDTIGSNPSGGWSVDETGGTVNIISEHNNHNKVLELHDTTGYDVVAYVPISETYGTIEFYISLSDETLRGIFEVLNGANTLFAYRIYTDQHQYNDGSWHNIVATTGDNTWYHIRIDYDCTVGGYEGLAQYNWRIYINETQYGDYNFDTNTTPDTLQVRTANIDINYYVYYDAFGFSWDSEYNIGDNLIGTNAIINFTSSISLSNFTSLNNLNLIYALNNTLYQTSNLSIYNFTSSSYYLIQSKEFTNSDLNNNTYFSLNSDFLNDTNNILVKFEAINSTTIFELDLNRLSIVNTSFLNISCIIDAEDLTNLLELQVSAYYYTSISQELNFSIYCYDNSSWVLINSSINYDTFYKSLFIYNSSNILDFFNSTQIKLQFYAVNNTNQFEFYVDFIQAKIYTKLELSYSLSFNIKGLYKYRFHVYGTDWDSTNWIYFEVVEKQNNIKMISESSKLTEWEFLSQDYNTIDLYESDFSSESWISDNDEIMSITQIVSDDSYTDNFYPDSNFDFKLNLYLYNYTGAYYICFFKQELNYLSNSQDNTTFYIKTIFKAGELSYPFNISIYSLDETFDESTITWNNQPNFIDNLGYIIFDSNYAWFNISLDKLYSKGISLIAEEASVILSLYSRKSSYKPYFINNIHKFTQSNSYCYIQTNTTETLNLRSPDDLNLNLQAGDKIEITFNTTSSNKIDLNLLNNNIEQTSYTISQQDNQNFNDKTITLTLDSNYTIDQLEFSGLFEDTKNLFIKNIKIYSIESSDVSETYLVNPYGSQSIFINFPQDLIVNVYEDNIQVKSFNLTTSQDLTTLVYEKTDSQINYVFLYDSNNKYLNFNDFIIYTNYTLQEYNYLNKRLSGNEFYTDIDSSIAFKVYDSFNSLIYSDTKNSQTFIDIDLPVYSLKIKNEATKNISYTLINNATSEFKIGKMFSQELIEFNIATGTYILNYTNSENNQDYSELINFNDNTLFTIKSTYFQVYFSLFNYDGLGLDPNLFRFYINNERKDFGFNTMTQDTNNLKILDYFNATLKNVNVNLRPYTEYNLAVSVYTMILNNKFNRTVRLEIERAGSSITFIATIRELDSVPYRFLSGIEYDISIYEIDNNTLLYHEDRLLDDPIEIVDFGFYQQEIPSNPVPEFLNIMTQWGIIFLFILVFAVIIFIAWTRLKKDQYKTEIREKGQSVMLKKGSNQPFY